MSDIEVDANCQSAIDTLIEAEESTRVALTRLEFRYYAELGIEKAKDAEEITAMLRALAGDTEEVADAEGGAGQQSSGKPAYLLDRDAEERATLEAEEDMFGRRELLLMEAEAFERLTITATFHELAITIDEAFKPCFCMMYKYPWDVNDYRVLPIKDGALNKVKHPERHLPTFLRKEHLSKTQGAQRLALEDHQSSYQRTLESLREPAPPLEIMA